MAPDVIAPTYTTPDLSHHYLHPNRPFPQSPPCLFDVDDPYSSESESPPPATQGHLLALDEYEAELYPNGWPKDLEGAETILEKITPWTTSISFFIDTIRSVGLHALFAGLVAQARLGLAQGRGEWRLREIAMSWSFSRGGFDDDVWQTLATLPRDLPFLRSLVLEGNELALIHPSLLRSIRLYGENFRLLLDGNAFEPTDVISSLIQHGREHPHRSHAISVLELGSASPSDALALLGMGRSGLEELDLRVPMSEEQDRKLGLYNDGGDSHAAAAAEVGRSYWERSALMTAEASAFSKLLMEVLEQNYWIRRLGMVVFAARLDHLTLARIKTICRRNVLLRTRTRRAALQLLAHARPILLARPISSPSDRSVEIQSAYRSSPSASILHRLPYELVLACLACLDRGALSSSQHERICQWAESRATLADTSITRKGFLRRVDCMRWESDQDEINAGGLSLISC